MRILVAALLHGAMRAKRWRSGKAALRLDRLARPQHNGLMLQACLNGGRTRAEHPGVPVSAVELARDAQAVVAAGAQELHVHPRGPNSLESLAPEDVAAALNAIRAAVPGVPVGVSTRSPIAPTGRARHAHMRAWQVLPDYVSVNIVEEDAPEVIDMFLARGVGVEAGLWSLADAQRFLTLPQRGQCLRVMLEINQQDVAEALAVTQAIFALLDVAGIVLPRLLHGFEATQWSLYAQAQRLGIDARIGFEDGFQLPDGSRAPDNAAMIRAAQNTGGR